MHAPCIGKVARAAAIFQAELCLTILRGLRKQFVLDLKHRMGEVGVDIVMTEASDDIEACLSVAAPSTDHRHRSGDHPTRRLPRELAESRGRQPCAFLAPRSCAVSTEYAKGREQMEPSIRSPVALNVWQRNDRFIDDLAGLPLPPELRRAARLNEI